MASSTESATMALSPISQSSCQDPLNIDRYLDFDQNFFPSPSLSPELTRSKSIATSASSLGSTSHCFIQNPPTSQQTFNGPSHQYDHYKQQTGLPVGALANTFAVNQADSLSFARNQQFLGIPPNDTFFGLNTTDDFFDFNAPPSLNSAISMTSDMDMDFGSPAQDLFLNSVDSSTVDPLAIGGQESSSSSQSLPGNTIRAWPGMHQQQAALAKAQAEAQQQKQQAAQQLAQKPSASSAQRSNRTTIRPPTDPIVEERISRLLNQMRHSSVASSNDDDAATPNASGNSSHGARAKKDEEDMDEDERLLASEEGKKLSSKERRQLRNKVSARAFRSRRKEYIGQLEGEIAAKAAEADELKVKNEELMAENTHLTDLTRMLLSSPAFSTFLSDLSGNGVTLPPTVQKSSSTVKAGQSSATRKDVNPHQVAKQHIESRQDVAQIGMALIPETTLDYGTLESTSNGWAEGNMDFSLYEAQVFTVMELPQGPAVDQLDSGILSGKSSYSASSHMTDDEPKQELPIVECMPVLEKVECDNEPEICRDDVEFDESDPAFALFADCPSRVTSLAPATDMTLFGSIEPEKAFGRVELVLEEQVDGYSEISAGTMEKFERICSSLEAASIRIAALIPHS